MKYYYLPGTITLLLLSGEVNNMDEKTLERIVKLVITYNGSDFEFDKKFLALMDNYTIELIDKGDTIQVKTNLR